MGILSKISEWRMKVFLWAVLPMFAFAGLTFGTQDLAPAWKAHNGGGTLGTFTAESESCGKHSCEFTGHWVAADTSARRLDDVIIYDEPDAFAIGDTTEALDSGARHGVFATRGGSTYLLVTGFVLGGVAALVGWVFVIRNAVRRRWPRRAVESIPA